MVCRRNPQSPQEIRRYYRKVAVGEEVRDYPFYIIISAAFMALSFWGLISGDTMGWATGLICSQVWAVGAGIDAWVKK
jgi:hypothetical protein